jgi:hypothetical protein
MDPERQHLLRPGQDGEEIKIIYGPDSIAFPASLHGKVRGFLFYLLSLYSLLLFCCFMVIN